MTTVAVTGAEGLIGRRLVDLLLDDPGVERVVGLDVGTPAGSSRPGHVRRRADVRDPRFVDHLTGADVLVHLAFEHGPMRDEDAMRAVNVEGARNAVQAAADVGVRKVVYVSSATVYGAHPDNPLPLVEDRPRRPNSPFHDAEHRGELEAWLWPWASRHPDVTVTVLRPSVVAGPGVSGVIARQLDAPRFPAVRGHRPPMQFVHVDDVASALQHVVRHDLPGAFNVSSTGWLSFDEVTAIGGRTVVEVPEELAFSLADRLWRLGLGRTPAGQVPYLMYPCVVSVDALTATGWYPRHSNRDALAVMAAEHADRLVLGPLRTRRSTVRNATLGIAAVAVAATGVQLGGWRRRRRAARRVDGHGSSSPGHGAR